ncbi:MAG: hypothetical protein AB7G48_01050 [Nitrospiraceae bacterium]
MPTVPVDIAAGFILLTLTMLAILSVLFVNRSRSLWMIVALMVAWTTLTAALALSGTLNRFDLRQPWIPILVLTQLTFVVWLAWFSSWSGLLTQIPQFTLVGLQCFRIPVELLLAALATRRMLAMEMTYYGRNFDVLAGVTAIIVAVWINRHGEKPVRLIVLTWNLLGLSLVSAVLAQGMLSVPYPFQLLHLSVPTFIVAQFPVVWLVTVLVPIAYLLHFVSIRRCLGETVEISTPSAS